MHNVIEIVHYVIIFIAILVVVPIIGSKFGQRLQAMEYGGMFCRGNETSLLHCRVHRSFTEILSRFIISNQRDYAGVRCIPQTTSKS